MNGTSAKAERAELEVAKCLQRRRGEIDKCDLRGYTVSVKFHGRRLRQVRFEKLAAQGAALCAVVKAQTVEAAVLDCLRARREEIDADRELRVYIVCVTFGEGCSFLVEYHTESTQDFAD